MDTPHPEINYPGEGKPQLPPVGFQEPPGQPGYPGSPGGYLGPQASYPGPYTAYPGPYPGPPVPPGTSAGAGQPGFPIQRQPGYGPAGVPWMPAPPVPPNCPPGLEYLSQVDQILVHQQIELMEVLTGIETNNKYEIKNSLGQRVYFAAEDSDFCTLNCCGKNRPFTLRILDNMGREVITMQRPLRCGTCCCPCCLQEIEIQAPPGVPIGYVSEKWHPCLHKFTVQNEKREDVLKITSPCMTCSCSSDIDFEIKSLDEQSVVGKISRQWSGFIREGFTDADNFGIQFPLDLDVKMKTVMLGACFLIDFMFFESTPNPQRR